MEEVDDADAPSELLAPLLEKYHDVLVKHVLSRLDPTDCALLAQVGKPWLAVVVANNLPRAGQGGDAMPLQLEDFFGTEKRLAWAKDNGCQWDEVTCARIARSGQLEVLKWARALDCPWDEATCGYAAYGGYLEVLQWAREHGCPWSEQFEASNCCAMAAAGGHMVGSCRLLPHVESAWH